MELEIEMILAFSSPWLWPWTSQPLTCSRATEGPSSNILVITWSKLDYFDEQTHERTDTPMHDVHKHSSHTPVVTLQTLLIEDCGLRPYHLADDTQIYGFCSPTPSLCTKLHSRISECIDVASSWMWSHRLQLNTAKTEIIWLTTGRRSHLLPQPLWVSTITPASPCGPWPGDSHWRRRFYEISRREDHVCLLRSITSATEHPPLGT